ncbi:hypothetical protein, partial [Caballeronia calidae]|uniref:hypothetical protein n=1 Tax=Caballeronia calidae TaxID=1777139 RepID=UPI001E4F06D2
MLSYVGERAVLRSPTAAIEFTSPLPEARGAREMIQRPTTFYPLARFASPILHARCAGVLS